MTTDPTTGHWIDLKIMCDARAVADVTEVFVEYGFTQGVVVEYARRHDGQGNDFTVEPGTLVTVRAALSTGDVPPGELEDIRHSPWVLRQAPWVLG